MHAGAVVYIVLGLWRLLVQIALIDYFGKMGKRFFKRLSDEVDAWFWRNKWRECFLGLLALFYIGASLKDCLIFPILIAKVMEKSVSELESCDLKCACTDALTNSLYVFEVWKL
jgi:hypothetical protein